MKQFARRFLAPALLMWSLALPGGVFAQSTPSESPDVAWSKLSLQAEAYVKEADFLTSGAHHPRVKDYYKASELYSKAANLYEQGRFLFVNAYKSTPEQTEQYETRQNELSKRAKTLIFKSFQANRVGANRESRGLL